MIDYVRNLLQTIMFLAFRWETPVATPSTGITAVMRGELRAFHRRGVFVAPWQRKMKQAQAALAAGKVRDTGIFFLVPGAPHHGDVEVRVLLSENPSQAPVIYLAPQPGKSGGGDDLTFFAGRESPYDTPWLREDAVFFARAVDRFAHLVGLPSHPFVWAADWETVPAMIALQHHGLFAVLHVHNIYDAFLGPDLADQSFPGAEALHHQTILKAGLRLANVKVVVNRGYRWGLQREPLYTRVMADHLQEEVKSLVPLDNAPFVELSPELRQLEEDLSADITKGLVSLSRLKEQARLALPVEVQEKLKEKALGVVMGRRVSQKGHDVAVQAVRSLLRSTPKLPILFFFATTHGDDTSTARLQRIVQLAAEFPNNVMYSDGHLSFYNELMAAAEFNIMPSLGEPHGGAFQGCVIPVARAIDGLVVQICGYDPKGPAAVLNRFWHPPSAMCNGWIWRETALTDENRGVAEVKELLLKDTPSSENETFKRMAQSLAETLAEAINLRLEAPTAFARIALGALRAQSSRSWEMNLGGVLTLVDAARQQMR